MILSISDGTFHIDRCSLFMSVIWQTLFISFHT